MKGASGFSRRSIVAVEAHLANPTSLCSRLWPPATFLAEFCCWWIRKAASHTGGSKRNAAFDAKFSCRLIVGIAARTAHFPSPQARLHLFLSRLKKECYRE